MARRRTDCELVYGLCEYLDSLRLHEGIITPQEAEKQVANLEKIRARVDDEIASIRARMGALQKESALGFPEMNFVRPMGAVAPEHAKE
jgi:hypothetical protein